MWEGKELETETGPCGLSEDTALGYGDRGSGNLLIHGDNLCALKALCAEYSGKVKCAYLDPPYNTGATFAHYDDSIGHGQWLSMMKSRLLLIRELLCPDGVAAVQIGFDEMAYLKVLMDELFGRHRCIGQVAVRMSHSAGMKRRALDRRMIKNTEYILLYYKSEQPELHPLYEACSEYPVNYYQYITSFPGESGDSGRYTSLVDVLYERFGGDFAALGLKKNNGAVKALYAGCADVRRFILQNRDRVVRKDSNVPDLSGETRLGSLQGDEFIVHDAPHGRYFIGKNAAGRPYQLYSIAAKVKPVGPSGEEALTNLVGDWWDGFYRDMSRVDVEGGVKMKTSKKPERLIEWILSAATESGDLVLDAFLGSGTTAAVAIKMRRRFIGIEAGDQCISLSLPRLRRVVDGSDPQGITRALGWRGGSGFRFFTCAPSGGHWDAAKT